MDVEVKIEPELASPRLTLRVPALTAETAGLLQTLRALDAAGGPKQLVGVRDETYYLLEPQTLDTVYAQNQKVYAHAGQGVFQLRQRLYDLEAALAPYGFVRISHSEIVNFEKVETLDMSIAGTITLSLKTGGTCYVSRRYVEKIKRHLGL